MALCPDFPKEVEIGSREGAGVLDVSGEGTYQMKAGDQVIEATVNTANDSVTITLPSVVQARGRIYTVQCVVAANSKHIYVQDRDGDDALLATIDLDTTADYVILFSNGRRWFILASEMA